MALVRCDFCEGEHPAGTARCPVTGALLRRPKPAPTSRQPGAMPSLTTHDDVGPDPHAALLRTQDPHPSAVAEAPGSLILRVLPDGPVVPLTVGQVVPLGRESSPIAQVCSDNVSRHHAEIRVERDGIVVVDLGSTNGTFLNDKRLQPGVSHSVPAGDTLRLGSDPALRLSFTSVP